MEIGSVVIWQADDGSSDEGESVMASKIIWVNDERNPRARSRIISNDTILAAAEDAACNGQPQWLSGGTVTHSYPGQALADYAVVLVLDGHPCAWACRAAAQRTPYGRGLPGPEAVARRCLPDLSLDSTGDKLLAPPWRRGATQAEIDEYTELLTCHLAVSGRLPREE